MLKMQVSTRLIILFLFLSQMSCAEEATPKFAWPNGAKAAVNLAYDDALNSQLDNAIPALNKYGFKGSFYVTISSPVLANRLDEWRAAAAEGHELGNHSIFHQCDGSLPDREWLRPHLDLTGMTVEEMVSHVLVANNVLYMIDGKTERTYTAPCGDLKAGGEDYIGQLKPQFVGIKSSDKGVVPDMATLDPYDVSVTAPSAVTGAQLIAVVKEAAAKGTIANFTFHGVGGDFLTVSNEAHNELLAYLAKHKDIYWVDTFLNIMKHVRAQQAAAEPKSP